MIGECQRRARFQRLGHSLEHLGESLREVVQAASHADITRQFIGIARGWFGKSRLGFSNQATQPDVAEIHEFSILNVSEVWRVGQDSVEHPSVQVVLRRIRAGQCNRALFNGSRSVALFTNPFALYKNLLLSQAMASDLKGLGAV